VTPYDFDTLIESIQNNLDLRSLGPRKWNNFGPAIVSTG